MRSRRYLFLNKYFFVYFCIEVELEREDLNNFEFPNFGHWRIRLQLLFTGKMPMTKGLPYQWYETPNIHFFTIKDFENLCKELKDTNRGNIEAAEKVGELVAKRAIEQGIKKVAFDRSGYNYYLLGKCQ